ncbi:hypothetical protein E1B28_004213 [Marasmius oreades]|uniref:ER membrane protein complex subunit 10 n=1 Tax=Marasmius oreades TaxID=181124 RepID=A0A9P7UY30_9AGAR|nr:uncharacterized protein E1B28_004213 [Marasmius oreades]KAG7096804.1 hypothetical protein E1B28_004213 [Marasmius oreades]
MLLVLSFFLLPLAVTSQQVNLYHRLQLLNGQQSTFIKRGAIVYEDSHSASYHPSPSALEHYGQFSATLQEIDRVDQDRILYQVALERDGDWDISSVKWCHLPQISSETLILHTTDTSQPTSHAIDYFVSPILPDGACPVKGSLSASFEHLARLNTTVLLRTPRLPPLPELRTPPPLTPEGKPAEPVPEKSFIQKYWMYIAAALVALLMSGGASEEGQGGQK